MHYKFPIEILEASKQERKDYFKSKFFSHPKFEKVLKDTLECIYQVKDESFISIYGPSGVGKSLFSRRLYDKLFEIAKEEGQIKVGTIPVAHIITRAPNAGKFSWAEYNRRLLENLKEPMIEAKIQYEDRVIQEGNKTFIISKAKVSKDLNGSVEKALQNRGVRYLIVDETQHIATVSKSVSLDKQLDVIKSVANVTDTLHILIGTYSILYVLDLSGQVARRDLHVHFPRYHFDNSKDLIDFAKVIKQMWLNLPLKSISENPLGDPKYFYDRTIGCIGILHDWLYRALSVALLYDLNTINEELLEKTALNLNQLQVLRTEAEKGEELERSLRSMVQTVKVVETKIESKTTQRTKGKFGGRNPKRDPVGIPNEKVN